MTPRLRLPRATEASGRRRVSELALGSIVV
jgi:hypothetical protein